MRKFYIVLTCILVLGFTISVRGKVFAATLKKEKAEAAKIEASHSSKVKPNFDVVFPKDSVIKIKLSIKPSVWDSMQADLTENLRGAGPGKPYSVDFNPSPGQIPHVSFTDSHNKSRFPDRFSGEFKPDSAGFAMNNNRMPGGPGPGMPPREGEVSGMPRPEGGPQGMPPAGGMENMKGEYSPEWGECTINFNGEVWEHVGIRYKGNSSLQSGEQKVSFKLDFDQFEDDYPEIKNQRFYGFKQLNLNNNFKDQTEMHEKLASDLFSAFGVPAAHTVFCEVYVDLGSGMQYFGLYTLVEEIDDTVLKTQFKKSKGNLYKPDGQAATFALNTFNEAGFDKKNNKKDTTYSDVKALYDVLHSDIRITDPEKWESELDQVFDVNVFLKWLAANTTIQNWDSYGTAPHNYFLYNNPKTEKLTWIPWDNNEAFTSRGGGMFMGGAQEAQNKNETSEQWPLINYILGDMHYKIKYRLYLDQFVDGVFSTEKMDDMIDAYSALIEGSVLKETTFSSSLNKEIYDEDVEMLKAHVTERSKLVLKEVQKGNIILP